MLALFRGALRVQTHALRAANLLTFELGAISGRTLALNGAKARHLASTGKSNGRGDHSSPPQKQSYKPRDESVGAIHACDSDWKKAVALLADLRTNKIASLSAFNAAIQVCARGSQSTKALELLHDMEDCNIIADVKTINSVIDACAKARQWQPALKVLDTMEANFGLKPDVISLNAAISACEKGGQWQNALELLESMEGRGLQPDVITLAR